MVNYKYWLWNGVLSEDFCKHALKSIDWSTSEQACISDNKILSPDKRITKIVWQHQLQPLGCVLNAYIRSANEQAGWDFSITHFEQTQVSEYEGETGGHYDWHTDTIPPVEGFQRKFTGVILLNDSSEFEGGDLLFKGVDNTNIITKQGSIIVFPSFIEHKVTPVTSGNRYTAVTWANGPSFR